MEYFRSQLRLQRAKIWFIKGVVYYYLVRWAWLMNHTLTKFSQLNLSSSTVLLRPKTARIALSLSGVNNQPMLKYSSTTAVDTLYVSMRCFYVTTHARRGRDVVTMTILRVLEIRRASHVTENWTYPCAKIITVMDLILSVFRVRTTRNIH